MYGQSGTVAAGFEPLARQFAKTISAAPGGGALVVRRRGETLVDIHQGYADPYGHVPWTRSTLAISFSTSKGIASTVAHRIAERGELDYDEPVATYWPEFAAGGKARITVRQLMSHRAGLWSVQAVASKARDLLDHLAMEEKLAASRPMRVDHPNYHAITYGWLIAGLLRRVTGRGLNDLVQAELAEPLGTDGLFIGRPADRDEDLAELLDPGLRLMRVGRRLSPVLSRLPFTRAFSQAFDVQGFHHLFTGRDAPVWETEMPAVNGAFTADALARLYGVLANGGEDGGVRLLSRERVDTLGRVQTRELDGVLGIRMRWRLGYHQALGIGREAPRAFGHYGYGGSGAWADPGSGISLGFVTNTMGRATTPVADWRLFRLSGLARKCARVRPVSPGYRSA
ncbi:MAG: beta-lactamase family protein [Thermoleophilaceae bacterium]|nr:beta-lactamase family protein [Thermoleophilaceae bacterium]